MTSVIALAAWMALVERNFNRLSDFASDLNNANGSAEWSAEIISVTADL